ncbi:hypothetical protein K7432_004190 [Basidiobolus ranarum]|uniref:UBA domain-containing protein n=1 Tax=Basidiobolus ranarum TaxID=34480 RepID=A0ABR2W506_9FUNG
MSLMYSALSEVHLTTTLKKKLPKSVTLPYNYRPLPHLQQLLQPTYDFKLEKHIVNVADEKRKEDEARIVAQEEFRKMADKEKLDQAKARLNAVAPGLSSEGEILQPIPVTSSALGRAASMSPELESRREMSPALETLRPASENKGAKVANFNYLEFENGLPPANPWDSPKTSEDDFKMLKDVLAGTEKQIPSHIATDPDFDPLAPVANSQSNIDTKNKNPPILHNGMETAAPNDEITPGFIARSITDMSLNDTKNLHLHRSHTYSYGQPPNSNEKHVYHSSSPSHIHHPSQSASFPSRSVQSYYGNNTLPNSARGSHSHSPVPHTSSHSTRYVAPPVAGSSAAAHFEPPQLPPKPGKSWYLSEDNAPPPIPPLPTSFLHEDQAEDDTDIPQARELVNMGFSKEQAIRALKAHDYDLIKATNYLLDSM